VNFVRNFGGYFLLRVLSCHRDQHTTYELEVDHMIKLETIKCLCLANLKASIIYHCNCCHP